MNTKSAFRDLRYGEEPRPTRPQAGHARNARTNDCCYTRDQRRGRTYIYLCMYTSTDPVQDKIIQNRLISKDEKTLGKGILLQLPPSYAN